MTGFAKYDELAAQKIGAVSAAIEQCVRQVLTNRPFLHCHRVLAEFFGGKEVANWSTWYATCILWELDEAIPNKGQSTMTTLNMTKELVNVAGASEVALDGFDPVAFFTDSKPVNGNFKITASHQGATYYFANKEHKKMFAKDPEKYAPQNGGFCTFGVSVGALFPVDISTWQVYNDKLYLNLNPDILEMFKKDMDGNIAKATKNWPGLVEKNAK